MRGASSLYHRRPRGEDQLLQVSDPGDLPAFPGHVQLPQAEDFTKGAGWKPLGFFSQKLSLAETRCSAFDRSLLACVAGIHHFWFIREGRQ